VFHCIPTNNVVTMESVTHINPEHIVFEMSDFCSWLEHYPIEMPDVGVFSLSNERGYI